MGHPIQFKTCLGCGKTFLTREVNKVYCSVSCEEEYDPNRKKEYNLKTDVICKMCGKHFMQEHGNQRYCSAECSQKAKQQQQIEYREIDGPKPPIKHRAPKVALKMAICPICGIEFHQNRSAQIHCSVLCANKAKRKPPLEPRKCLYCGKEYQPRTETSKYCCTDCGHKARIKDIAKKVLHENMQRMSQAV